MSKRIDYAARERHARFRETARAQGKRQLGTWISREAAKHLDALQRELGDAVEDIVSAAILAYRNGVARNISSNVARDAPAVYRNASSNTSGTSGNQQSLSPEVTELVKHWRAEGASWAECARRLDEQGIPTPRGGPWLQGRGQTNLARYFRD
jgi:hypothetical protein